MLKLLPTCDDSTTFGTFFDPAIPEIRICRAGDHHISKGEPAIVIRYVSGNRHISYICLDCLKTIYDTVAAVLNS